MARPKFDIKLDGQGIGSVFRDGVDITRGIEKIVIVATPLDPAEITLTITCDSITLQEGEEGAKSDEEERINS